MKIVHVINYFQPQLGYQETFLAQEHMKAGHDVFVVTSDRYHPFLYVGGAKPVMGVRIKGNGFFIELGIQVWRLKATCEFPNIIWLIGLENKIKEIKPDLVIMHGITNFSAIRMARLKKKLASFKLIYDDHAELDNTTGKMKILYPLFKILVSDKIDETADGLVAVYPMTRYFMHFKYGLPFGRISVITHGVNSEIFHYDEQTRLDIRKELHITSNEIVFIYASKIIPSRQIHVFIQAIEKITKVTSQFSILMIGSSDKAYLNELKRDIDLKGLSNKFLFLGAVKNDVLYRYYSASDISIWPHGPSVGMWEAMACRVPIIVCETSSTADAIDSDCRLTYREGDSGDLAHKIEMLLDAETRRQMGITASEKAKTKYSWKTIAQQFLDLVS